MDYYEKILYIPEVNKNDEVIGKVERWKAHREGILHRGFTVALLFEDTFVCQHRKHPVFGGYLDLTASSHPVYEGEKLQSFENAIYKTLEREWAIGKDDLKDSIKELGKVYYHSKYGEYTEHEICYFFAIEVKKLPTVQFEYAYGFSLLTLNDLKDEDTPYAPGIAPWVKEALKQNLLD